MKNFENAYRVTQMKIDTVQEAKLLVLVDVKIAAIVVNVHGDLYRPKTSPRASLMLAQLEKACGKNTWSKQ